MEQHVDVPERLALKGVTRRDFMKFCGFMATVLWASNVICAQNSPCGDG